VLERKEQEMSFNEWMAKEKEANNQRIISLKEDQKESQEILSKERSEIRKYDHEERKDIRIERLELNKQTTDMVKTFSNQPR
jgi:hypothetical protein